MTKNVRAVLAATILFGLFAGFQNCGSKNFSNGAASDQSSTAASSDGAIATSGSTVPGVVATGNTITNTAGQSLAFVNNINTSIGNVSVTNAATSSVPYITVSLFSPAGRKATVKVMVDGTGKFLSVQAGSATPYMCHDQSANACTNYPNLGSGQMESNCNSPIYFTGSLTGSVSNLTDTAWTTFCQNAQTNVCHFTLSGGGSANTGNMTLAACQAHCRTNANANPTETLTCTFSGVGISF